jgi:hypothetical protein
MGKPFTVELHLQGGKVVQYTLDEDEVRNRARVGVAAGVVNDPSEPDERKRLRTGAYDIFLKTMDPTSGISADSGGQSVSVIDGDGVWVIPPRSIAAVRLVDPETAPEHPAFGFVDRGGTSE